MRHRVAPVLTVVLLGLVGCSDDVEAPPVTSPSSEQTPAPPSAAEPTAEEVTPTTEDSEPTTEAVASVATENEVASVIAGYEEDWREVIDDAGDCRFKLTDATDDPLAEVERITCYAGEATAGVTAENAVRKLNELEVPPSMEGLVEETVTALEGVSAIDLESVCGRAMTDPMVTDNCSSALGSRMWAYDSLETVLDKWRPYL